MNYQIYKITSIYEETNRKRTREIKAHGEEQAIAELKSMGYIEPFEVRVASHPPATERQIAYARDLGNPLPDNVSIKDASAIIDKTLSRDSEPNDGLIEFATGKGIFFSLYIGKKSLYNLVFQELDRKDKIAFTIFSIYRYLSDDRHANMDTSPHKEKFYAFAEETVDDKSFWNSLSRIKGRDLRFFGKLIIGHDEIEGTPTDRVFFKKSVAYLKEVGLLEDGVSYVKRIKAPKKEKVSLNKKKSGCLTSIVFVALFMLSLISVFNFLFN